MIKFVIFLSLFLVLIGGSSQASEQRNSIGFGVGALYNGAGFNILSGSDQGYKYFSVGCASIGFSDQSDTSYNCGVGLGIIFMDLFSENNKHGAGLHVGVTHRRINSDTKISNGTSEDSKTGLLFGLSYSYFFKGAENSGWNFSIAPFVGRYGDDTDAGVMLGPGYQF